MKLAYENNTRSRTGEPGTNYWQNRGEYSINLTATPPDRMIKGSEDITYFNNSPDSLNTLILKFFMNAHKPGAARSYGASEKNMTTGMQVDSLAVNGVSQPWTESSRPSTVRRLRLPEVLAPGESVKLHFNWHYQISLTSGREGMIDSTTYFLAYFYPRVAVYDDYLGWDTIEWIGKEFYSDFNDYTVNLTVPKNYIVWGTGTLKNPDEVLQENISARFKRSLTSDEVIHLANFEEVTNGKVTTQANMNTWSFEASNIPDMAFGLSDHFVWDAGSVMVDDSANRRASVQAAYNDTSADYHQMIDFGKNSLDFLSHHWPAVPYPYEKTTVFQGYAGMEYPMMANDETYSDPAFSEFVAEHEIAHTYFPFYMGINESRYAFMDEGWATTFELLFNRQNMGDEKANQLFKQFRVARWIHDPSTIGDLPIITPADMVGGSAYGNNAYGKPSLGYLAVKDMLGDELFKSTLHGYMERWNGKHPSPWDFFYSFNDLSGQNMNWFWKNWYFENSYIDIALTDVKKSRKKYTLSLENIGGMPAPVDIEIAYADESTETLHQTSAIWKKDQQKATVEIKTRKEIRSVQLDGGIWMDADLSNNSWKP